MKQWKSIGAKYHHLLKWILFVQLEINGWTDRIEKKRTALFKNINLIAVVAVATKIMHVVTQSKSSFILGNLRYDTRMFVEKKNTFKNWVCTKASSNRKYQNVKWGFIISNCYNKSCSTEKWNVLIWRFFIFVFFFSSSFDFFFCIIKKL